MTETPNHALQRTAPGCYGSRFFTILGLCRHSLTISTVRTSTLSSGTWQRASDLLQSELSSLQTSSALSDILTHQSISKTCSMKSPTGGQIWFSTTSTRATRRLPQTKAAFPFSSGVPITAMSVPSDFCSARESHSSLWDAPFSSVSRFISSPPRIVGPPLATGHDETTPRRLHRV